MHSLLFRINDYCMIDEKTLAELKQALETEKEKLEKELSSFADKDEDDEYTARYVDYGDSEEDNAEEYRQHEVNLSLSKRLESSLVDTKEALAKINAGTYGVCEVCNTSINPERLKAYPAARTCIDCSN